LTEKVKSVGRSSSRPSTKERAGRVRLQGETVKREEAHVRQDNQLIDPAEHTGSSSPRPPKYSWLNCGVM
jgi:hypothetical protein